MNNEIVFSFPSVCEIKIREVLKGENTLGLYVWDCSLVLSLFLYHNRDKFKNGCVIDLSGGCGLIGMLMSKLNNRVIITDKFDDVVSNLMYELKLNGLENNNMIYVQRLEWGEFIDFNVSIDLIVSSDCFYDIIYFDDILATITYYLSRNKGCKFITTYYNRDEEYSIEIYLNKWGLKATEININSFMTMDLFKSLLSKQQINNISQRYFLSLSSCKLFIIAAND